MDFLERVKTTDCQAELRRLLQGGPPIWLSDRHALPLPLPLPLPNNNNKKDNKDTTKNDKNGADGETIAAAAVAAVAEDTHVCALWYAGDDTEVSAKLVGAVEGDDRDNLWTELKEFLVEEGKEPGDDK